jgi:cytochrome c
MESSTPMSAIRPILFALAGLVAAPAAYTSETQGDAVRGEQLFMANGCPACHGVTPEDNSKVGPNLIGVVGRQAGTTPSLLVTENLKKYGVTWSAATLDEFLANPSAKVPGTAMGGILTDPQQRADVIAYLSTLKD